MIKKLRRRIIVILTTFIALIGIIIVVIINFNSYRSLEDNCKRQVETSIIMDNSNVNSNIETNMVTCVRTTDGYNVYNNTTELDIDEIKDMVLEINDTNERIGHIGTYYYLNAGIEIRIMNFDEVYQAYYHSLWISIGILFVIILTSVFFTYRIAEWTVKPVRDAFDKQKMFISDVSHELKTPIAIIQTNTEILQLSQSNKQLDYISYETGRMNTLITKLLQLTRIETNPLYSELIKGNMSHVVSRAAMPFESLAYEQGFTFECNIEENVEAEFNETLVEQLVTILLDNALKHTKEAGKITITLNLLHHHPVLTVSDEGDEIAKADQDKIFERFYRVDQSRNRKDNRYGLGLSIAKSAMEVHHGTIGVESGNGITTFICKFK